MKKIFKTSKGSEFNNLNDAMAAKEGPIKEYKIVPAGNRLVSGAKAQAAGYMGQSLVEIYQPEQREHIKTYQND
jgi:hypothetical protein